MSRWSIRFTSVRLILPTNRAVYRSAIHDTASVITTNIALNLSLVHATG